MPAHVVSLVADALNENGRALNGSQVLVIGEHEDFVPRPLVEAYARAAERSGDPVRLVVLPSAGHFEIASPRTAAWPRVRAAIRSLLDGRLPDREPS